MRLSQQLLRSKTPEPLSSVQILDLSKLDLVSIERLSFCPKIRSLCLHGNSLQSISNLEECHQIWSLDVSNNNIRCLGGLNRFVAFGTLVLANNDICWSELAKIRNIHILELTLSGNPRLQRDPFYRLHVIDCLPHVWLLDGKFITSAERLQVKHFFEDSALSSQPVRHKLPKHRFTPTSLKNISVTGVYGEKATHLLRRFPTEGSTNIETDKRRVMYLAYNLQQELILQRRYSTGKMSLLKFHPTFLEEILKARPNSLEQCNMLILLLVASLEFSLPRKLMKETLMTSKLDKIGDVYSLDLFLLPRETRCHILTVLMNRVKVDKDIGQDGGLYNTLYQCLMYTVSQLNRLRYSKQIFTSPETSIQKSYKTLLASEVVQLLCIVPCFFQYIDKDSGVANLLIAATKNPKITQEIVILAKAVKDTGVPIKEIYDEVSEYILERVEDQLHNIVDNHPKLKGSDQILSHIRALPMKQPTAIAMADFHTTGQYYPNRDAPKILRPHQGETDRVVFPHLGDRLLLGPQTVAKIVALPQPFLALVLMDTVPDVNGAMVSNVKQADIHYTYTDIKDFQWSRQHGVWQPKGTVGDRITIQRVEDHYKELEDTEYLALEDTTGRPNSPVTEMNSPTRSPTRDAYSPRKLRSPDKPRPMSAVLKEKLHLNLDLTERPNTASCSTSPANYILGIKGEKVKAKSRGDNSVSLSRNQTTTSRNSKKRIIKADLITCMPADETETSCQMEDKELVQETGEEEETEDNTETSQDAKVSVPEPVPASESQSTKLAEDSHRVNNLLNEVAEVTSIASELSNIEDVELNLLVENDDPELQNSPSPVREPDQGEVTEQTSQSVNRVTTPVQQVAISLPRVDHTESLNASRDESSTDDRASSQKSTPRHVKIKIEPRLLSCLETRPITAVDAYKFVVQHPLKVYQTYQRSRRNSAPSSRRSNRPGYRTPTGNVQSPREPDSPDAPSDLRPITSSGGDRGFKPKSRFNVTLANNWLGGGRDIHSEVLRRRPKSSHTPGWKEGLPKKTRPKCTTIATQTSAAWDGSNLPSWIPAYLSNYDSILEVLRKKKQIETLQCFQDDLDWIRLLLLSGKGVVDPCEQGPTDSVCDGETVDVNGDGSPRDSLQLPDLPSLSDYIASVQESQHTALSH